MKIRFVIFSLVAMFILHCELCGCLAQSSQFFTAKSADFKATSESNFSFSPYKIKKLAKKSEVDLQSFWEKLEIDAGNFDVVRNYQIDVYPVALDHNKPKAALLVLNNFAVETCRFVLFDRKPKKTAGNFQWKLIGFVDVPNQRNAIPEHRIVKSLHNKWLVLKEKTSGGSNLAVYQDNWYEIKTKEFQSVLQYVSKGYESYAKLSDRNYQTKIVRHSDNLIEIVYTVDWNGYTKADFSQFETIFSQTKTAFYFWDQLNHQFVFDESRSKITKDELQTVFNEGEINKDFYLRYNYKNLLQIARNGRIRQKDWLKFNLKEFDYSTQERNLQRILKRKH